MSNYAGTQFNRMQANDPMLYSSYTMDIPEASAYRRAPAKKTARRSRLNETGRKAVRLAIAAIVVIFAIVALSAYTAHLQYNNNLLQSNIESLQAEIDSMESQIVEQTKVTRIEKIATDKYGMVYPTAENCVTINSGEQTEDNLAASIRAEAYN